MTFCRHQNVVPETTATPTLAPTEPANVGAGGAVLWCAKGTFDPNEDAEAGQPSEGQKKCEECSPGKFQPSTYTFCWHCPDGKYSLTGQPNCEKCQDFQKSNPTHTACIDDPNAADVEPADGPQGASAAVPSPTSILPASSTKQHSCACNPALEESPFLTCTSDATGVHVHVVHRSSTADEMALRDREFSDQHVCKNVAGQCKCCICEVDAEPVNIESLGSGYYWIDKNSATHASSESVQQCEYKCSLDVNCQTGTYVSSMDGPGRCWISEISLATETKAEPCVEQCESFTKIKPKASAKWYQKLAQHYWGAGDGASAASIGAATMLRAAVTSVPADADDEDAVTTPTPAPVAENIAMPEADDDTMLADKGKKSSWLASSAFAAKDAESGLTEASPFDNNNLRR
jgi:hypothetical protein